MLNNFSFFVSLGLFGSYFALMGVIVNDYQTVLNEGFFVGYNRVVVTVIVLQVRRGVQGELFVHVLVKICWEKWILACECTCQIFQIPH